MYVFSFFFLKTFFFIDKGQYTMSLELKKTVAAAVVGLGFLGLALPSYAEEAAAPAAEQAAPVAETAAPAAEQAAPAADAAAPAAEKAAPAAETAAPAAEQAAPAAEAAAK